METYERIRELRKTHLRLSQSAFGEKLGVNRDVINNIENNRLAKPEQKLSLIKLMCKEFSVNEEWLLNGTEPMFIEPDTFSLDNFAAQHGATDIDLQIVKTYFELPADVRSLLIERFRNVLNSPAATATEEMTVADVEDLYKKNILNSAQKTAFTASNTTNGTDENTKAVNED
jgi:DNA-binding XRE family transcriptional regulator